ncbi:large subunit ribosomal protein L28 [Deinobacterium chartae]|uniref:Large ribosomal subunit protein bL28 n=1 Tax=Deinobacterium chartae TaxID=521158 RepID=A0A841I4W7_9DEIO|nr:50S ribosomal protein L28 [Deinobacterium chartae]MBB6099002.1 large subunit ribosomal protein L28 [Deinobacterium chartae]
MAKVCELCGKGPIVVNSIIRRGKARAEGGVGRKVTGITKSRQVPNLQRVRIRRDGAVLRLRICTKCLKTVHTL